jgi:hypothetical protein
MLTRESCHACGGARQALVSMGVLSQSTHQDTKIVRWSVAMRINQTRVWHARHQR